VLTIPRGKHSAKPDEFAAMIEQMFPNVAKLEMFARQPQGSRSQRNESLRSRTIDSPIKQGHHVRMARLIVIVEPHESLPGSEESQPSPNAPSCWKPSNKEPRKPSLHSVRHLEIRTPRYHRQSRYETVAVSVSEMALHPVIPVGNAPARIL
jgi:hypothetical protein